MKWTTRSEVLLYSFTPRNLAAKRVYAEVYWTSAYKELFWGYNICVPCQKQARESLEPTKTQHMLRSSQKQILHSPNCKTRSKYLDWIVKDSNEHDIWIPRLLCDLRWDKLGRDLDECGRQILPVAETWMDPWAIVVGVTACWWGLAWEMIEEVSKQTSYVAVPAVKERKGIKPVVVLIAQQRENAQWRRQFYPSNFFPLKSDSPGNYSQAILSE